MPTIFISYSRADAGFVRRLVEHLKSGAVDYWLDIDQIQAGEDWSDVVWTALQSCDLMLLVLSPSSMSSKEVANEWKYYLNAGKPIIPVLVNATTNIHYQLVSLHYIDFERTPFDQATYLLDLEIARVTGSLDQPESGVTVPTTPDSQMNAEPLPGTGVLDPSKVSWDKTTARINFDLAKQIEDRLHHFDEQMLLEFISLEDQTRRLETRIRVGREYVVGRVGSGVTPDVDLTPLGAAHQGISRKHAALRLDGDTLFIKDLQSTNFTYVEGKRLRGDEQLALKSGDRIQMGNLLLMVNFRSGS